jgi:hypothetical protein
MQFFRKHLLEKSLGLGGAVALPDPRDLTNRAVSNNANMTSFESQEIEPNKWELNQRSFSEGIGVSWERSFGGNAMVQTPSGASHQLLVGLA